jgi:hypothetical protein
MAALCIRAMPAHPYSKESCMSKTTLTILAFAVVCSSAIAAENTAPPAAMSASAPVEDCASLQKKYDSADKSKVSPNRMKDAKAQRVKGGNLCASGNVTEGMKALKNALAEIGA